MTPRRAVPAAIAGLVLLLAAPARAQVAKVELGRAFSSTAEARAAVARLQARFTSAQAQLDRAVKEAERKREAEGALVGDDALKKAAQLRLRLEKELQEAQEAESKAVREHLLATIREVGERDGWRLIVDVGAKEVLGQPAAATAIDLTDELIARHDARYPAPGAAATKRAAPTQRAAPARVAVLVADVKRAADSVAELKAIRRELAADRLASQARANEERAELQKVRAAFESRSVPLRSIRTFLERKLVWGRNEAPDDESIREMLDEWDGRIASDEPGDALPEAPASRRDQVAEILASAFADEAARRGAVSAQPAQVLYFRPADDDTDELVRLYDATHPPPAPKPQAAAGEEDPLGRVQTTAWLVLERDVPIPVQANSGAIGGHDQLAVLREGGQVTFHEAARGMPIDGGCHLAARQTLADAEFQTARAGRMNITSVTISHASLGGFLGVGDSTAVDRVTLWVDHPVIAAVQCKDSRSVTGMSVDTFARVGGSLLRLVGHVPAKVVWAP